MASTLAKKSDGPKPLTDDDKQRMANELTSLQQERDRLTREIAERNETRDEELREAKRVHFESRQNMEDIKEAGAAKLAEQTREREAARKQDAARIVRGQPSIPRPLHEPCY